MPIIHHHRILNKTKKHNMTNKSYIRKLRKNKTIYVSKKLKGKLLRYRKKVNVYNVKSKYELPIHNLIKNIYGGGELTTYEETQFYEDTIKLLKSDCNLTIYN